MFGFSENLTLLYTVNFTGNDLQHRSLRGKPSLISSTQNVTCADEYLRSVNYITESPTLDPKLGKVVILVSCNRAQLCGLEHA